MVSTVLKAKVKGIGYGFDSHRLHQIFSYLYNKKYLCPPRANVGGKNGCAAGKPNAFLYICHLYKIPPRGR